MQILRNKTYSIGDASRITGVSQRKLTDLGKENTSQHRSA